LIPGDVTDTAGYANEDGETDRLIGEFLDGRLEAVRTVADWAKSVAAHRAWGFETPEDVVQATLLALVQNLREGRFKGGNLRAYVRRIAKNMCVTNYRKIRSRGEHISLDESTHRPPARLSSDDVERRALLNEILGRLDESCRQVLLLAYVQGFSRKEIGERLQISEEAARVKLFRCIRNARAMFGEA